MNYLPQLTESEVRYICSAIPLQDSIYYFQRNPKEFAKIMPGFRAMSMKNKARVSALLFRCRKQHFISSFIEKCISNWLSQIQEHITKMMEDGDSKELALLRTLPFCFFADNVGLFFKLTNEEYSEEYIMLLSAAVKSTKETSAQQDRLQKELKAKESEIRKLQAKLDSVVSNLERARTKLNERNTEVSTLKRSLDDLKELKFIIKNDKEIIEALETKIQMREENINDLKNELAEAKNSSQQLEAQFRAEYEKQRATMTSREQVTMKPKCPSDIEEFKDYLGYNLENIGVSVCSEFFALLKEHLSKILFQGIPIVVSRNVGATLMKCVANALIEQPNVKKLVFSKDYLVEDIDNFLSSGERVVCLDNFIGNCNETELLPLFDKYRDKVIFLTVAYDRTIYYVSREFLRYCHYLNLNRIAALSINAELTEDPSMIEEVESKPQGLSPDNRYSNLLREMLGEFGFHQSVVEQKCSAISDEQDLCRTLAFDVLPYCVDVLQVAPYNTSERFLKYAGDTGRCPYKNLFKGWFLR